jgi:hypothetical protein
MSMTTGERQTSAERWAAEILWRHTGGSGPVWQVVVDGWHEAALAEDRKRGMWSALDALHRDNPRHPLFRALHRQDRARRALERADRTVEHECWMLRQEASFSALDGV